jgi:diguanylate cyclase (GGDEF)-like protein
METQAQTNFVSRNSEQMPIMQEILEIQEKSAIANDLEPKRLELASVLQKTLEPKELLSLFAVELGKYVPFDGLSYEFQTLGVCIRLGSLSNNRCSYNLKITDEHLGEICLYRETPFKERELAGTENMLAGLLYPLRNTLLYQQALRSASTDPLTGVKNRSAMESAMKRELGLANRQGYPLSLILFDIDHFKKVNDQYGHLIGDQVLRSVAQIAQETIRDSDIIFRFGGEEFLILLNGTQLSGAALLAERIRRKIEKLQIFPELDMHVAASFGVVALQENESAETIFMRVDNAMYRAKNNGRNRVVVDDDA